jgi:hypothetical protein
LEFDSAPHGCGENIGEKTSIGQILVLIYKNKDSSSERLIFKSSKTSRGSYLDQEVSIFF